MNCRSFQRRLQLLLDERLPPEDDHQLQRHAWKCERCQQLLAGQQQLFQLLSSASLQLPQIDLTEGIVSRLHQPEAQVSTAAAERRITWAWIAVAASLLILISPLAWRFGNQQGPEQPFAQPAAPSHRDIEQYAATPSPPASVLNQREYEELLGFLMRRVADDPLESVDEITGTLRPITASFGVTIDALRKTFPIPSKDGPHKPQAGNLALHFYA